MYGNICDLQQGCAQVKIAVLVRLHLNRMDVCH
jgi:hypothetical protein